MLLRYVAPLIFLLVLATAVANIVLLSAYPSLEICWWINQEVYGRLRGIIYLLDNMSLSPITVLLLLAAIVAVCAVLRKSRTLRFVANHAALVSLLSAGFSSITERSAAAGTAPILTRVHFFLTANWDLPILVGLVVLAISCAFCHLDYLRPRRQPGL